MDKAMIRLARTQDAVALTECIQAAYAPVATRGVSLPSVDEGVAEDIAANLVWVAEIDGRVIAGLIAQQVSDALHILNLVVHPDGQGQGLAKSLMALAQSFAATRGLQEMRLATHRDMPENVALYRHLGWLVEDQDGVKIIMSKQLSD